MIHRSTLHYRRLRGFMSLDFAISEITMNFENNFGLAILKEYIKEL